MPATKCCVEVRKCEKIFNGSSRNSTRQGYRATRARMVARSQTNRELGLTASALTRYSEGRDNSAAPVTTSPGGIHSRIIFRPSGVT